MGSKRVTTRTCVVCRRKDDKRDLTRLVRTNAGIVLDASGKLAGRGAYLCDNPACWARAAKTPVLAKALRTALTDADREIIRQHTPQ